MRVTWQRLYPPVSARINKNDKNDARGIAQMLRVGLYKEVSVKSDEAREVKFLLGCRSHLINTERELKGTIRGLLKMYGVKIRSEAKFFEDIEAVKKRLPDPVQKSIEAILSSLREIGRSRAEIDVELTEIGKKDEDCKRLMTIPGVGVLTALMYKATIDRPERFIDSYNVGAYLGLTPKQYASGEINRYGHVSKMGSKDCRTALYEAAQCLLTRSKANSTLKVWGLRLMKRIGRKKAIVAVARKLGVIMHRMLIEKTEFRYSHKEKN